MPQKDQKQTTHLKGIMGNPLVKRIIYQLPHGEQAYKAAEFVAGKAEQHPEVVTKVRARARDILDDLRHRQRQHPRTTFVLEGLEDRLLGVDGAPRSGDLVVMNDQANGYGCTKEGSYGILKKVVGNEATVEFHYVTGQPHPLPASLVVDKRCVKKAALEDELRQTQDLGFKVHDKVRISEASIYAGQHEGEGKIVTIDLFNEELPYVVQFADGYQNNYSREDLEIATKKVVKTPKTEVKLGAKDKKHDATCVHQGLAGKVCHYISRVSADHIVGSIITAVAIYAGQWAADHFSLKAKVVDLFRQQPAAQTSLYEANKPVVQPTILVLGDNNDGKTVETQTAQQQMPDQKTMERIMKVY